MRARACSSRHAVLVMKLVSHVNADGDLIRAFVEHYLALGVTSFHIVLHGSRAQNATLVALASSYPIHFEDEYDTTFDSGEKCRRLNALLKRFRRGEWLLLVDSDEFLELPYDLRTTVRLLEALGCNALRAPLLQRISETGALDTPEIVDSPHTAFPLCSVDLYAQMGNAEARISKYPLFRCGARTRMNEGGNHSSPNGARTVLSPLLGVSHHFKWRRAVLHRLHARANSQHTWRRQSVRFASYLAEHENRVPVSGAFRYSRAKLFELGLLRRLPRFSTLVAEMLHSHVARGVGLGRELSRAWRNGARASGDGDDEAGAGTMSSTRAPTA